MDDQRSYFLHRERLGFAVWRERDLPLAIALWGDPEVTKFIDVRGTVSDEQVNLLLHKHIAFQREHRIQYWPIFLLSNGELVGPGAC